MADAANDDAKHFYKKFGFVPLADDPMRLFLPFGHPALQGPKEQTADSGLPTHSPNVCQSPGLRIGFL